jgi:MarR family transcriptional regulator, organic hydroperoxide resistance regulator
LRQLRREVPAELREEPSLTRKTSPSATEEGLGATLDFMRTVWALNHALEVTSKLMEAELGVTAQQRMTVRIVGKFPGITAGRVAELLKVHRATVSVAINRLEQRQILKRGRDGSDKRRVTLTLTKKGKALDVAASGTVESAVEFLIENASARDLSATRRAILEMISALEQRR